MARRRRNTLTNPRVQAQRRLAQRKARNDIDQGFGVYMDASGNFAPRGTEQNLVRYGVSNRMATSAQQAQRVLDGYSGRGRYGRFMKALPRIIGGAIGGVRGIKRGMAGMSSYNKSSMNGRGRYRKRSRRTYRGRGDYTDVSAEEIPEGDTSMYGPTQENQLIGGSNPPISVNAGGDETGDITFAHTEFVSNVTSSGATFNSQSYGLNPGLLNTFPFLGQIAKYFTLFEFNGLIFQYKPTSGEFGSGNNQLGKVIMATEYDPDAVPFPNSKVMENYDYANASKPSLTINHGVETASKQMALKMLYVRSGTTARDKIFTDIGTFQIATEGIPDSGIIGELWVTYNVKLSRAQIAETAFPVMMLNVDDATNNLPFGTIDQIVAKTKVNNTGAVVISASTLSFTDSTQLGNQYILHYDIQGTSEDADLVVNRVGALRVAAFRDYEVASVTSADFGASPRLMFSFAFQITAIPCTVQVAFSAETLLTPQNANFYLFQTDPVFEIIPDA